MGVELEINQVKSEVADAQSKQPGDFSLNQVASNLSQSTSEFRTDESAVNGAENYSAAKAGVKTGLNVLTFPVDPVGAARRQGAITKTYAAEQKAHTRMHQSNENEIKERLSQIQSELRMQLAMRGTLPSNNESSKGPSNVSAKSGQQNEPSEG